MKVVDKIAEWQKESDAKLDEALKLPDCDCTDTYCEHMKLRDAKLSLRDAEQQALGMMALYAKAFTPDEEY